ncbi:MAG: hypothetical protein AAFR81_29700 [Chloroflexota bacterium]
MLKKRRYPPRLRIDDVIAALDSLYFASDNPDVWKRFYRLQWVQCQLQETSHILIDQKALTHYWIQRYLCTLIHDLLQNQQQILHIPTILTIETVQEAEQAIQANVQTGSARLIGWSILYYVYVRRDLNITLGGFAIMAHLHERTLRRYKHQAAQFLLHELIEREITVYQQANV